MRSPRLSLGLAALVAAGLAIPAAATTAGSTATPAVSERPAAKYFVGAAVKSISPTKAMIDSGLFYLGGYGLTNGKALDTVQTPVEGRNATGVMPGAAGVHVRAIAFGDGTHVIELAQIETQGYFASYKQGPFGIEEIRADAAKAIKKMVWRGGQLGGPGAILVDSNHSHGGPDTTGVWGGVPTTYLKLVHDRTVAAFVEAYRELQPATLSFGTAHAGVDGEPDRYPSADPLLTNQFRNDPRNQVVDDEIRVLQARSTASGEVIATYSNFSGHPTVLGSSNTLASSDYTGPLSEMLASNFGGVGFDQVATLGRTQPARDSCKPELRPLYATDDLCKLYSYAGRVYDRVKEAVDSAQVLRGTPIVKLHSYLLSDAATNAPLIAMGNGGYAIGAPIYRTTTPPWFTANLLGTTSFSGRIGNILISGGPGEMYPQIVAKVRNLVPAAGHINIGTAGDFLGYIVAPLSAYPEPIRASMFDGEAPPTGGNCSGVPSPVGCPSPIDNDNYFFNVSHTFGMRLTCAMLRGAGDAFGKGKDAYWSKDATCAAYANDYVLPKDFDTTFPAQPDLSAVLTH